jgi:hypothetical protein
MGRRIKVRDIEMANMVLMMNPRPMRLEIIGTNEGNHVVVTKYVSGYGIKKNTQKCRNKCIHDVKECEYHLPIPTTVSFIPSLNSRFFPSPMNA